MRAELRGSGWVCWRSKRGLFAKVTSTQTALPLWSDIVQFESVSTPSGTYHIVALNGLALDVISESVAKESYPLRALKLNRCAYQKWRIEPRDFRDVYAIRWAGAQPRVLQPDGQGAKPNAQVFTALSEDQDQEHWLLRKEERGGSYAIIHRASGLALSLREDGPAVILDDWKDEDRQHWQLIA